MSENETETSEVEKMRVINARLPEDLREALDEFTEQNGVKRSSVIRLGIALAINKPELAPQSQEAA